MSIARTASSKLPLMGGTVSRGHLARYCDEFAFRYENRKVTDGERTHRLVAGAEGKRLTYKQPA